MQIQHYVLRIGMTAIFLLGLLGMINIWQTPKSVQASVSEPISSSPKLYLDRQPTSGVYIFPSTTSGYAVQALLKNLNSDKVITDQSALTYYWSADKIDGLDIVNVEPFAVCTYGIQTPCPYDHATISTSTLGPVSATNIRVKVVQNSTQDTIAETTFYANVVPQSEWVNFTYVYPTGGESFRVGQEITIAWTMSGQPVDYYNLYYWYYEKGMSMGGYIGTVYFGVNSFNWIIPKELRGQQVKVAVEPRRNELVVGEGHSGAYFKVK